MQSSIYVHSAHCLVTVIRRVHVLHKHFSQFVFCTIPTYSAFVEHYLSQSQSLHAYIYHQSIVAVMCVFLTTITYLRLKSSAFLCLSDSFTLANHLSKERQSVPVLPFLRDWQTRSTNSCPKWNSHF